MTPFAQELLRHRKQKETLESFAERIDCNPSYIFRLKSGSRRPSMTFIERTAMNLGISESAKKTLIRSAYLTEKSS